MIENSIENQVYKEIEVGGHTWIKETFTYGYYVFKIRKHPSTQKGGKEDEYDRRFSEIEWLHNNLLRDAAGCKIPALPDKNILTNIVQSESVINLRKKQIENYLNYLNSHPYIKKNQYFLKFFSYNFDKEKEEIQIQRSYYQSFKDLIGYPNSK